MRQSRCLRCLRHLFSLAAEFHAAGILNYLLPIPMENAFARGMTRIVTLSYQEVHSDMLNFEHITDQNWLTSCQQHIQELLPSILPDVVIDEDSLEPIDDNESEYEGVALYHNKRYYCFLSRYEPTSFQEQAAACVAEALVTKSRFLILV